MCTDHGCLVVGGSAVLLQYAVVVLWHRGLCGYLANKCRYLDSMHKDVPKGAFEGLMLSLKIEASDQSLLSFSDTGWNFKVAHLCMHDFPKQVRFPRL